MEASEVWRRCGPCKKPIAFGAAYFACSVSTCRKQSFCSKDCFAAHVPVLRHKDAWPEEAVAPAMDAHIVEEDSVARDLRRRRVVGSEIQADEERGEALAPSTSAGDDILVVASKLKQYIKARSQMNTSALVMDRLSEIIRRHCDQAIKRAREDGRKTVLDRDFV